MSSRIKILDPLTANQIAAGEVVERPASVVKELVENAIDAGASKIEIELTAGGADYIRVSDNGCGISRDEIAIAFQRHATSKISESADLAAICSLGFRGEALPSIASVSMIEVLSREASSLTATRVFLSGGDIVKLEEAGGPVGTTFIVKNLFFNTPARRKFLKSTATELGQISDLLGKVAMAYPAIAIKLISERRTLLQTPGNGNLLEPITQVYGKELAREMLPINVNAGDYLLSGYLGKPQLTRSSRSHQSFFVNGRYVKSKLLSNAVSEGYHTLVLVNRYPVVVLNLSLPPRAVDVNVHPTKLEVRFAQESFVLNFVSQAIVETLRNNTLIPGLHRAAQGNGEEQEPIKEEPTPEQLQLMISRQPIWQKSKEEVLVQAREDSSRGLPVAESPQEELGRDSGQDSIKDSIKDSAKDTAKDKAGDSELAVPALAANYQPDSLQWHVAEDKQGQEDSPPDVPDEPRTSETELPASKLPDLLPLGQINLTYIIARGPDGLYIIDQHAAHERINYESLWEKARTHGIQTQLLLNPLTLELSGQEMQTLVENIILFTDLGFLLEHFGGNTFLLRGHPADLQEADPLSVVRDLLDWLMEGVSKFEPRKLREEMIYRVACKASVRANERLNQAEMEQLIWRLGQTESPYTCPHGRPTVIAITAAELAKRFQRV
ncbi:MAG TPA: DNA mismatch repair endonuclease MutL [Desulfobacteria bacterium]|nr:DNA mismatch repair endonuclease MutL [Desulfobacteria bacterium]